MILDVDEVIESNFEKDANIKEQEVSETKSLYTFDPDEWEIEKYEHEWAFQSKQFIKIDLSGLDTSKVTDMSSMFSSARNLVKLNLGEHFDTTNVTNMNYIFRGLENLLVLDLGKLFNFQLNPEKLSMFRVSKKKPLAIIHPHPEIFDEYDFI